eukprot:4689295-Amphidinium_carterae.2
MYDSVGSENHSEWCSCSIVVGHASRTSVQSRSSSSSILLLVGNAERWDELLVERVVHDVVMAARWSE